MALAVASILNVLAASALVALQPAGLTIVNVGNATRHSASGGDAHIESKAQDSQVRLEVRNPGVDVSLEGAALVQPLRVRRRGAAGFAQPSGPGMNLVQAGIAVMHCGHDYARSHDAGRRLVFGDQRHRREDDGFVIARCG